MSEEEGLNIRKGSFTAAPRLETERLILRPHRLDDFFASAAMWRDPQVVKFTIGSESTPQRSWQRLLAYCGHWSLLGFGYWAVECKSTQRYIGELGFADFRRQFDPSIEGIPEIGWALCSDAHGYGYATEALRRVIEWGDLHLDVPRTVCIIHSANLPSLRLARKLGYSFVVAERAESETHLLLARDAKAAN
jgi:RimJ/RimL family protein N-acetyltransferase